MNIDKMIKEEIFDNNNPRQIFAKLDGLLTAFSTNKQVLLTVEKHYSENIKNEPSFSSITKKRIFNLLKKSWLNMWLTQNIEKSDLEIIKIYFEKYIPTQQAKLSQVLKEKLGEIVEAKQQSPLTLALKDYRKGNFDKLEMFVKEAQEIKLTQLERIKEVMYYNKFIDGSLPIWTEVINKCPKTVSYGKIFCFFSNQRLLTQPAEDIEHYLLSSIENYKKYMMKKDPKYSYAAAKKAVTSRILNIDLNNKESVLGTVGDLLYDLSQIADKDVESMQLAFKNCNYLLTNIEPHLSNFLGKKFGILKNKAHTIEYIFEFVPYIIKNFDLVDYYNIGDLKEEEFEQKAKEVISVYRHEQLTKKFHQHDISDTTKNSQDTKTIKRKI